MLPMIECLKYSPLTNAQSRMENVPLSILSKAYSSANYIKEEQRIMCEIHDCKTSITKSWFFSPLQLPQTDDMINLESVTSVALLEMFYQMGYKETLTAVSKFRKPNLPPQWNDLFTLLFKGFSKMVTGSEYASKLFMAILNGLYIGSNIDYSFVLWAQLVQSTLSTTCHSEISCTRFSTLIVHHSIDRLKISLMQDTLMASISTFHTIGIIISDSSSFPSLVQSHKPCFDMCHLLEKSWRGLKKGDKNTINKEGPSTPAKPPTKRKAPTGISAATPKRQKQPSHRRKSPTPSEDESLKSETQSDIRVEEEEPHVHNEEGESVHNEKFASNPKVTKSHTDFVPSSPTSPKTTTTHITIAPYPPPISSTPQTTIPLSTPHFTDSTTPPITSAKPGVSINASDAGAGVSGFTTTHISPLISPFRTDDPDMIYGDSEDDLQGFTFSPFTIKTSSNDEALVTKGQLKAIHDKLDSLLQYAKPSSSDDYS
ncbi:unnamed protein product [Lactuca saligna]|uniref:Uncharacterized protein n=1 Tax=Lactuca saligna TaxID=75948 RepID=A0AA35ZAE8_LACSI|nr:unnamed protein product [Lactuca saligna]